MAPWDTFRLSPRPSCEIEYINKTVQYACMRLNGLRLIVEPRSDIAWIRTRLGERPTQLAWTTLQVLAISRLPSPFTTSPYNIATQNSVLGPIDKLHAFVRCILKPDGLVNGTERFRARHLQSTLWWSIELVKQKGVKSLSGCHYLHIVSGVWKAWRVGTVRLPNPRRIQA